MGVFFRLRNAQLGQAHGTEILAQAVADRETGIGHLHMGHGGVILRGAHEGHGEVLAGEAAEFRVHKGPGDLPGPVGPEVEEDHAVVVGNGAVRIADHRLHEFVGDAVGVGVLHGSHRHRVHRGALAVNHGVIGGLYPVPALVPVHGVEAAHHRGDLADAQFPALFHRSGHKVGAGGGGHVPAVQEGVDIDLFQAPVPSHLHQGEEMVQVGVDAAVAEQAHEMQGGIVLPAGVHGVDIGGIFKKGAVLNGLADAGQVLKHHAACADVGVAYLAVAHLPLRQADVQSGGGKLRVGVFLEELVQAGRVGSGNGIALRFLPQAEAVHDDERGRSFVHKNLISHKTRSKGAAKPAPPRKYYSWLAALTISTNCSGFREAPPMRPPSISGWASSSAAFLGFMLPPY